GACLLLGSNGKSDGKAWEWWKVAGVEGSGGNGAGGKTGYREMEGKGFNGVAGDTVRCTVFQFVGVREEHKNTTSTNTFHNSLPEFENFYFDLKEISSGSTTTRSDISLPDYESFSFFDDHIKEISSGSTTTHSDVSLSEYDSFIFDLSNDQFPPTNRSYFTHEEFGDELTHIISPPEYDCFYFRNFPDPSECGGPLLNGSLTLI
nr:hypothetical protein [Tanacetum cinerariifolium]